jgi:hypothetical protein
VELSDHEFSEIASFFAKRFPPPNVDDVPGESLEADWKNALLDAAAKKQLYEMVAEYSARCPEDENLQALCSLLPGESRGSKALKYTLAAGVAASLAVVSTTGLAAIALGMWSQGTWSSTSLAHNSPPSSIPHVVVATAEVRDNEPTEPAKAHTTTALEIETESTEAPLGLPTTPTPATNIPQAQVPPTPTTFASAAPAAAPPIKRRSYSADRCRRGEGEIVGYWYAGKTAPGMEGETIAIERDLNVRVDFPDRHNNYNFKTDVRCVLRKGDLVHLSKEPMLVPGDYYWVPLVTGDLTKPVEPPTET